MKLTGSPMSNWTYERIEMTEIGVLRYNMVGIETNAAATQAQPLLIQRLASEPQWSRILLDYTRCKLSYTISEFSERIQYLIEHLPAGVKLAYVFSHDNFVIPARASRLLAESGVPSQAFSNVDEALDFLAGDKDWVRRA